MKYEKDNEKFTKKEAKLLTKILENTSVNFLLGAGASYIKQEGSINYPLMKDLLEEVRKDSFIKEFYDCISTKKDELIKQVKMIYDENLLSNDADIEEFLSKIEAFINLIKKHEIINKLQLQKEQILKIIFSRITTSDDEPILKIYEKFYNSLIKANNKSEKISTKKYNVFTTNYDMLNEASMERLKLYYYSGFFGIYERKFNMSYYNYSYTDTLDLYGHKYYEKTNYVNLYKLHGSLSWKLAENSELTEVDYKTNLEPIIIYPSMTKYNLTNLIVYYQSLLREFSSQLQKPNSSLFVIGNSLSDEHLVKIIENALDLESFNLVIFTYSKVLKNSVVDRLSSRENVYVFSGDSCTLDGFSEIYNDEYIEGEI